MQPDPDPEPEPEPDTEPMEPDVAEPVPEWESSCSCSRMSSRLLDEELPSLWASSPGESTCNTRQQPSEIHQHTKLMHCHGLHKEKSVKVCDCYKLNK